MYQVGFEMIDQISQEEGIPLSTIQSKALVGIGIYLVFVLLGSFFSWVLMHFSLSRFTVTLDGLLRFLV